MSLTLEQSTALQELYPNVVLVIGNEAFDAENNPVPYDIDAIDEQVAIYNCKVKAREILYKTDWTTIPDIALPENNPYLMNQDEFIAYRNIVRGYAVNPVANPDFPTAPTEQWSS